MYTKVSELVLDYLLGSGVHDTLTYEEFMLKVPAEHRSNVALRRLFHQYQQHRAETRERVRQLIERSDSQLNNPSDAGLSGDVRRHVQVMSQQVERLSQEVERLETAVNASVSNIRLQSRQLADLSNQVKDVLDATKDITMKSNKLQTQANQISKIK